MLKSLLTAAIIMASNSGFALEHRVSSTTYENHRIYASDISKLEITVSKEVETDGCNGASLYGDINKVLVEGSYTYEPYLADFGIMHTELACPFDVEPVMQTVTKKFVFEADDRGIVGLKLTIPAGFELSFEEISEEPEVNYEYIIEFRATEEEVVFVVWSGGCTDKSKFDLVVTEDKEFGLIRKSGFRCEAVAHPVEIKYTWEELNLEPMSVTKVAQ